MLGHNRTMVMCDMAETYGIYDMWGLPLSTTAALACGLREDSRIRMSMRGDRITTETLMLATIADSMRVLTWMQTEDGHKGTNRPKSILNILTKEQDEEDEPVQYATAADFDAARAEIIRRCSGG